MSKYIIASSAVIPGSNGCIACIVHQEPVISFVVFDSNFSIVYNDPSLRLLEYQSFIVATQSYIVINVDRQTCVVYLHNKGCIKPCYNVPKMANVYKMIHLTDSRLSPRFFREDITTMSLEIFQLTVQGKNLETRLLNTKNTDEKNIKYTRTGVPALLDSLSADFMTVTGKYVILVARNCFHAYMIDDANREFRFLSVRSVESGSFCIYRQPYLCFADDLFYLHVNEVKKQVEFKKRFEFNNNLVVFRTSAHFSYGVVYFVGKYKISSVLKIRGKENNQKNVYDSIRIEREMDGDFVNMHLEEDTFDLLIVSEKKVARKRNKTTTKICIFLMYTRKGDVPFSFAQRVISAIYNKDHMQF